MMTIVAALLGFIAGGLVMQARLRAKQARRDDEERLEYKKSERECRSRRHLALRCAELPGGRILLLQGLLLQGLRTVERKPCFRVTLAQGRIVTHDYDKSDRDAFGILALSDVVVDLVEFQEDVEVSSLPFVLSSLPSALRTNLQGFAVEQVTAGWGAWLRNDADSAKVVFDPDFTYEGRPIHADFELSYENLAPYVTDLVDYVSEIEGHGLGVDVVTIENKKVAGS